ncbi:hypothetical protein ES708_12447 [subsurface metagenome]
MDMNWLQERRKGTVCRGEGGRETDADGRWELPIATA